MAIAATEVG